MIVYVSHIYLIILLSKSFWKWVFIFIVHACVNPPDKNLQVRHIKNDYMLDSEVEFGDSIWYQCEEGYHFSLAYHMTGFNVTCQSGGIWESNELYDENVYCLDPSGTNLLLSIEKYLFCCNTGCKYAISLFPAIPIINSLINKSI